MLLTIFTPTYNRANLLERLYYSLLVQTNNNFEWVIIDDGSKDNTGEKVNGWINEGSIKIKYLYKSNGGKHTAHNIGVENSSGDLCVCVDSDDYLTNTAVENILLCWEKQSHSSNCAGIIGQKKDINNTRFISKLPKYVELTLYELDYKYKCIGDKCFILKTDIAQKYYFPIIENEKFFPESYVFDKIGASYTFVTLNEDITMCEYQEEGYSNNFINLMLNNPTGFKAYYFQRIDIAHTTKERLGYIIRYNAFDILSNDTKYNYQGKYSFLVCMLKPLGWILTKYYNFKRRK